MEILAVVFFLIAFIGGLLLLLFSATPIKFPYRFPNTGGFLIGCGAIGVGGLGILKATITISEKLIVGGMFWFVVVMLVGVLLFVSRRSSR